MTPPLRVAAAFSGWLPALDDGTVVLLLHELGLELERRALPGGLGLRELAAGILSTDRLRLAHAVAEYLAAPEA